jgi:hypothetical protein
VLFGDLQPGEDYLYHYTSAETAQLILESGMLRMSPYAGTNDPRESRVWSPALQLDVEDERLDYERLVTEFNAATRERVKLTCLSLDGPNVGPMYGSYANRGFARPRMWAQYGYQHTGVCLIFSKSEVDRAFTDTFGNRPYAWSGPVSYHGSRLGDHQGLFILSASEVVTYGEREASLRFVERNRLTMLFAKNPDWMTEAEFRYVVMSDSLHESLVIAQALVGVVCGMDIGLSDAKNLKAVAERLAVTTAKAQWMNGLCDVLPM